MIYEYALEPEMVAAWGDRQAHRFYSREFGLGSGRLISRYPKRWAKKVWDSFSGSNDMDRKRLEEFLTRLQDIMIKRKGYAWEEEQSWLDNALAEHARHPFRAVLARGNPKNQHEIICEDDLGTLPCHGWDNPHGISVTREAHAMANSVSSMLSCCRWVKFIDPHMSPGRTDFRNSLKAFLNILASERPVGPPELIEIHTALHDGTSEFLQQSYGKLIPIGLQMVLYQWQERIDGQKLHNRYILTDIGGVSFQHGLDTGKKGETDDINRLDIEQYKFRCKNFAPQAPAFDIAADPLIIKGLIHDIRSL